jgi:hypothetical protein
MTFDLHIGIDYSGPATPLSRTSALQVYVGSGHEEPQSVRPPKAPEGANRNWCRREIAEWLIDQARSKVLYIAGMDHGFSFPMSYFEKYKLKTWEAFLEDFCQHWPTDGDHTSVDFVRAKGPDRIGSATEFRLTEKWTSSAKSPEGRSVIMEVYPSLVHNRYPKDGRTNDEHDAYAVARWLREMDRNGFLSRYFDPPLRTSSGELPTWRAGSSE